MLGVLTPVCAYSFRHPHFSPLHLLRAYAHGFHPGFTAEENAPLPLTLFPSEDHQGHASAGRLIPTILGASPLDW